MNNEIIDYNGSGELYLEFTTNGEVRKVKINKEWSEKKEGGFIYYSGFVKDFLPKGIKVYYDDKMSAQDFIDWVSNTEEEI